MSWTLKVRDRFSAAHYLEGYRGKCEKVHGHTFRVEVAVRARELDGAGIGYDFTEIRKALAAVLPDHAFLNEAFPFNPSAENLARHFYGELKRSYPVASVTVWESEDASATYAEDD
ncbi:MAG TPA: 6-carboxytetrahydropterin synthase [Candidatus Aminicenantes bacterium]|nr:6-carboxytetrahydropterin synthase [Candidatus Aminicenantes bacterium]